MGRGDLARQERRGGTGTGAVYGQGDTSTGRTAVGIATDVVAGPAKVMGKISFDTGVAGATLLAGMVLGLIAFNVWTRGHQG